MDDSPHADAVRREYAEHIAGLEIRSDYDEDDSVIPTDEWSSSVLPKQSSFGQGEGDGRSYHTYKEGKYLLPNDMSNMHLSWREQNRLDLQHQLWLLSLDGKLHIAPLETVKGGVQNVLDFGTGTGNWAIDFATAYPTATVTGTDLSPHPPAFIPPNCTFSTSDAEDPWSYPHLFTYIHGRALASCFASIRPIFASAYHSLSPGGYLEMQDFSMPWPSLSASSTSPPSPFAKWVTMVISGAKILGKDLTRTSHWAAIMRETGFVDVQELKLAWPIGPWASGEKMRRLGEGCARNIGDALEGLSMSVFTRALGMESEEIRSFLAEVRKEIQSREMRCFIPIYVIYGRKPE